VGSERDFEMNRTMDQIEEKTKRKIQAIRELPEKVRRETTNRKARTKALIVMGAWVEATLLGRTDKTLWQYLEREGKMRLIAWALGVAEQERKRQAEQERRQAEERQRQQQEQERRQAELERQRQQQENKEYQQKYHYFSSTKKLINRYKNIEIGHDAEGKIFLRNPELILKYSEIPSYHLQDLRNIYLDVKESILNDLNKRIEDLINSDYFSKDKSLRSFLERTSRKFYETPIQVLSDQELIDLFPIISELEQNPDYQDFIVFRQYEEHQDFYNKSLNYNDSPFYKSSSIYYENDDKKEEIDLEENDEELEY